MNGIVDDKAAVKKAFFAALEGRAVTVKGVVSTHDETLTKEGVQMIHDYLKLADLKIVMAS